MEPQKDGNHRRHSPRSHHRSGDRIGDGTEEEALKQVRHHHSPMLSRHRLTKPSASPSLTSGSAQPAGSHASPTTGGSDADKPATPTTAIAPSAMPSGFPLGTYSLITFLDTVQSACTANNATWACPPNTNYYDDPQKALTILTWMISGSSGAYKISSKGQDATFGTMFQNEKLELLDAGKDTERFRFQLSRTKTVNMTGSIGDQSGDFQCDYGATNIQGSLYTKMARTYPKDTIAVGNTGNPSWPFGKSIHKVHSRGTKLTRSSCTRRTDRCWRPKRPQLQDNIRRAGRQLDRTGRRHAVQLSIQELDATQDRWLSWSRSTIRFFSFRL
jgi:hypothetical protein